MYIINEYQTNNGSTAIVTPATMEDRNSALSIFFSRCASAVTSNVEVHTVQLVRSDGYVERTECFRHDVEVPEPEEENEY